MDDALVSKILWWIVTVDLPVLGGLLVTASRFKREMETALMALRDNLTQYKLDVAQSYASTQQVKDLELRLVAHLLRIETKLENSLYPTHRDKN